MAKVHKQTATDASKPDGKSNLDLAWVKIQNGRQQETEGKKLWIEGTLELISILDDARKRLGSDQAFGTWLSDNGYGENRITRHDRSALLNMAADLNLTREVLAQTHRRSWRHIWEEEVQSRLPHEGQPTDAKGTEAPTRRPKKKSNEDPKPDWFGANKGWFNNQVTLANTVIGEVTKAMEHMTPGQWDNLAKVAEPRMLETIEQGGNTWIKLVALLRAPGRLKEGANTLIRGHRIRTTPARRASVSDQPSA